MAARIGDGFVTVQPDHEFVSAYRAQGGTGPTLGALKVCWDSDEARARKQAHDSLADRRIPGQLNQELPMPAHFEQASELVTEDMVAESIALRSRSPPLPGDDQQIRGSGFRRDLHQPDRG